MLELRARHEDEASRALVVRLVEGVEETARDESREDRLGRVRRVDDDLAPVGETKDVNGDADDVSREISSRVVVLHQGRVALDGTVSQVVGSELVRRIYAGSANE